MCNGPNCLGYLLFVTVVGFSVMIYLLLKYRARALEQNLAIKSAQVWNLVADRAKASNLREADLLYGIWQDGSSTEVVFIVRNSEDVEVGRVVSGTLRRESKLFVGEDEFTITRPLTWNLTANLSDEDVILASYAAEGYFGKHRFEVASKNVLISKRVGFSSKYIFDYLSKDNRVIATKQSISSGLQIGKIGIIPSEFPMAVRIFILAMGERR
jgi:hypothetical protein